MKNITGKVNFTTNYNFKVIRDGKIIQEENTHNVILDQVLTKKIYYSPSYGHYTFGRDLLIGDGTGTPSSSDTALFHQLWELGSNMRDSIELINIDDENSQGTVRYVFTIPATSNYVGTITECGLKGYFSNNMLHTHALVRDAEGNPISINKTALDKVIITIDLTLSLGVTDSDIQMVPFSKSPFRYALYNWNTDAARYASSFHFFNCVSYDQRDYTKNSTNVLDLVLSPMALLQRGPELVGWGSNECVGVYPQVGLPKINNINKIVADNVKQCTGRIAQNAFGAGKVCYVKGVLVYGTFVITLPNATYFPPYALNGINVGVASADMTEMLCPLDHFVKDSEIIYKNGVALTREVDYTIDSENNHRGLVELTAANDAIITGGITTKGATFNSESELFRTKVNYYGSSLDIPVIFISAFSTEAPLFFDMQKEVTLNFLRVPTAQNYKYTLSYSENEIDYEEHTTHTFTASEEHTFEFIPVTARYFKLEVSREDGTSATARLSGIGNTNTINNPEVFFALGYKTDGMIKFTSPLAEGDIITMDCMMDLPYKTDNNVIDYDFSVSL